jgi:hypothetical protein
MPEVDANAICPKETIAPISLQKECGGTACVSETRFPQPELHQSRIFCNLHQFSGWREMTGLRQIWPDYVELHQRGFFTF